VTRDELESEIIEAMLLEAAAAAPGPETQS
jgi:hypothetical protein